MEFKSDVSYRKESLKKLLKVILQKETEIIEALYQDFKKPAFEAVLTETHYVISDLKDTIKKIDSWAKPKKVLPSILNFPSRDYIYSEPYGKVLIISPWNYPFQLALCPLIAAVSAGNSVILKPSELTPNTSKIIAEIIAEAFEKNHVDVVEGGIKESQNLLSQRWDYIFFTGSVAVGKIVAKAAAENLTPITLELGGKNPCIIDETANLKIAAKRIVWGKFINGGQTCIAPDYLLVKPEIKDQFIDFLKAEIIESYSINPEISPDFCQIVNDRNWQRLVQLIEPEKVVFGGKFDEATRYISPTLISETDLESAIMKDEIFGPLLPILTFNNDADLDRIIPKYEKPLALYVFSDNYTFSEKIIQKYSFGGGCINDTVIHFSNKRLPFGGVGHSGIGAYHGSLNFDTFSHKKGIVKKANWLDLPLRYAPYNNNLRYIKKLIKWL
jgi:aldehyde dehydrogenase (NAD+)